MLITEKKLRNLIKKTLIENALLNETDDSDNIKNITDKLTKIAYECVNEYPKIWNKKIITKEIGEMNKINAEENVDTIITQFKDSVKKNYPFEIIFTNINKFLPILSQKQGIPQSQYYQLAVMVWKIFMFRHQKKIKSYQNDSINIPETGNVIIPKKLEKMMKSPVKLTDVPSPKEKSVNDVDDILPKTKK